MIKKASLYLICVIVILYTVRELLYIGIRKNQNGVYEKYKTVFLKENSYNVLFLGSSRTEMHFNTRIFDSITGMNSYNIGVTGATPRIAYSVLKAYCSKSKNPEYLIFDLDYHFLKYGIDTIRNFPRYFPFLQNDVLLQSFSSIDSRFNMFKYNAIYSLPFSNVRMLAASLHGWLGSVTKEDSSYYKGFTLVNYRDTIKQENVKPFYAFIHPMERLYIDSIIQYANTNSIKLLLLTSPMYCEVSTRVINKQQIISQLKNIARINHLRYSDFSLRPYSKRKGYFSDFYHMNGQGASLFTGEFALFFQQYSDKNSVNQ